MRSTRSPDRAVVAPGPGGAASPALRRGRHGPVAGHGGGRRTRWLVGCADDGAVTAELAVGMLSLVAVTALLLWALALASVQLRLIDAAGEGARAAARGEPAAVVRELATAASPGVTAVDIRRGQRHGVEVTNVTVTARPPVLGGLTAASVTLRAEATARVEQ